jgi:hypothetical protein
MGRPAPAVERARPVEAVEGSAGSIVRRRAKTAATSERRAGVRPVERPGPSSSQLRRTRPPSSAGHVGLDPAKAASEPADPMPVRLGPLSSARPPNQGRSRVRLCRASGRRTASASVSGSRGSVRRGRGSKAAHGLAHARAVRSAERPATSPRPLTGSPMPVRLGPLSSVRPRRYQHIGVSARRAHRRVGHVGRAHRPSRRREPGCVLAASPLSARWGCLPDGLISGRRIRRRPPASPCGVSAVSRIGVSARGMVRSAAEPLRPLSADLEALSGVGAVPRPLTGSPTPVRLDPLSKPALDPIGGDPLSSSLPSRKRGPAAAPRLFSGSHMPVQLDPEKASRNRDLRLPDMSSRSRRHRPRGLAYASGVERRAHEPGSVREGRHRRTSQGRRGVSPMTGVERRGRTSSHTGPDLLLLSSERPISVGSQSNM